MIKIKKYIVERNSPCPCCSGKKFKLCCQNNLDESFYNRSYDLFEQKNYKDALDAYRAHLTKYTFWFNEHTKFILKTSPETGKELLLTDINAFVSIINSITKCLYNLVLQSEIDPFLIRAKDKVDDLRYKFYIDALRSFWLGMINENSLAKKVMLQYSDFDTTIIPNTEFSVQFIKTYLHTLITELSLSKCIFIVDRLLGIVNDKEEIIDLLSTKVFVHFIYKDFKSAKILIEQIEKEINSYQSPDPHKNNYIKILGANVLELKGFIYQNDEMIEDAVKCFKDIVKSIEDPKVSDSFYSRIGNLLSQLHQPEPALEYFNKVVNKSLINTNYEYIKSLLEIKKIDNAKLLLDKINLTELEEGIKLDFLSLFAELAILDKDKDELGKIILKIKELDIDINIFEELQETIIHHLITVLNDIYEPASLLSKIRSYASKYLLLQPSFFGVGININEIVKPKKNGV